MRETLLSRAFATQTASSDTAMPIGSAPTGIVAVTALVEGSTRDTVSTPGWVIQSAPAPTAMSAAGSTILGRATTAFVFGLMRISVDESLFITQTASAPTAKALSPAGTGIAATSRAPRGSAATEEGVGHEDLARRTGHGLADDWLTVSASLLDTQTELPAVAIEDRA